MADCRFFLYVVDGNVRFSATRGQLNLGALTPILLAYLFDHHRARRAIFPGWNSGTNSTSNAVVFSEMLDLPRREDPSASSIGSPPAFCWRFEAAPSACRNSHRMPDCRCRGKRHSEGWHWVARTVTTYPTTWCCCLLLGCDACDGGSRAWRSSSFAVASTTHDIPCKISPAMSGHI